MSAAVIIEQQSNWVSTTLSLSSTILSWRTMQRRKTGNDTPALVCL